MTKSIYLAIWLHLAFMAPLHSQITGAFGQIAASGNSFNPTWKDNIWLHSAVGISIGRHFDLGVSINQLWQKGNKPYFEHLWEGGPFIRAKWNLKEYYHLYAEIGGLRGNICPCESRADYLFTYENGINHLSFTNGLVLRLGESVYGFVEFSWKYLLKHRSSGFAYLNGSLGVRYYLSEHRFY